MKKVINLNGTLVELNKIKGVSINDECFSSIKLKSNYLKIELQNRKEYIINPETNNWELHDINDEILIEYPNSEHAEKNFFRIKTIWENAINE
jgi:hypothetical protein